MPVSAIVFDIGGVLEVNPRTGWRDLWAARLHIDPAEFARRLDPIWHPGEVGGTTLREVERGTAEALSLDRTSLSALMGDAWAEYVGTLNRDMADYFTSLRPHYRTGILSNSFVGARGREQELYGFEDMCDVIVYSHEAGWMKPDPRIYHAVCDRLGVAPDDAVLLDDVRANVDGARAVGMRAVTFVDNEQAIADLEQEMAG